MMNGPSPFGPTPWGLKDNQRGVQWQAPMSHTLHASSPQRVVGSRSQRLGSHPQEPREQVLTVCLSQPATLRLQSSLAYSTSNHVGSSSLTAGYATQTAGYATRTAGYATQAAGCATRAAACTTRTVDFAKRDSARPTLPSRLPKQPLRRQWCPLHPAHSGNMEGWQCLRRLGARGPGSSCLLKQNKPHGRLSGTKEKPCLNGT